MTECNMFDDLDDTSRLHSWQLLEPKPKAAPLPEYRRHSDSPRFRAPFQVSSLTSSADSRRAPQASAHVSIEPGLGRPPLHSHAVPSLHHTSVERVSVTVGLPAPQFTKEPPRSLIHDDLISEHLQHGHSGLVDS